MAKAALSSSGIDKKEWVDADLHSIIEFLHKKKGADFSNYKVSTVKRRIHKRMGANKVTNLKQYLKLVNQKSTEIELLYSDLLIGVTNFFRDREVFQYLKKILLPRLLKSKKRGEILRIWVPGCSTGEEVYSIAILLHEIQEKKSIKIPFQIFATDLNEKSIARARNGEYTQQDIKFLSKNRLEKFFSASGEKYRIKPSLREVCVFSVHNLLSEPAFSRMDLISCCNLLIYFDATAQRKVMSSFHFSLNEGGFLLLGKSETTGTSVSLFTQIHKKIKIFRKKMIEGIERTKNPEIQMHMTGTGKLLQDPILKSINKNVVAAQGLTAAVDNLLLDSYVPACAIINFNMEVLHFRGDTSPFFKLSGRASLNILKIARPDFLFDLRSAINAVLKNRKSVKKTNIEANSKAYTLEVSPVKIIHEEPLMMVTFKEHQVIQAARKNFKNKKGKDSEAEYKIRKLEEALLEAKLQMQQVAAEQEAMIEELQTANEEIVSSNEELRTVNEELETSKEEIEAANEELISSNKELQMRNEEVESLNTYSNSILETIPDPMLILDKSFNIKSVNEQFLKTFRLHQEDVINVSLFKLDNDEWNIDDLEAMLQDIISNKTNFKKQQIAHRFRTIGEKVLIVSAKLVKQKLKTEQLTLLIIEDITEEIKREEAIKLKEKEILATQLESQAKVDAHKKSLAFLESVFIGNSEQVDHLIPRQSDHLKLTGKLWLNQYRVFG